MESTPLPRPIAQLDLRTPTSQPYLENPIGIPNRVAQTPTPTQISTLNPVILMISAMVSNQFNSLELLPYNIFIE
jgi:hypothetical protein